jgi:Phage derived protein Gp49-like (DUF891)
MPLTFRCYTDPQGRDVIREWYNARDEPIQGAFLAIIESLQRNSRASLNTTIFKKLEKRHASKCVGFHEIRIDHNGHHYRIIGVLDASEFTMLWPFYKNISPRYTVPCQESTKRKLEISLDRRRANECTFPADED